MIDTLNVLIAGTSSAYLDISRKILKFHHDDCEVDFAHSREECLGKIYASDYDLVLLDFDLGDGNALDILTAAPKRNHETSIVVLVEQVNSEFGRLCLAKGADDFIIKEKNYLTSLPSKINTIINTRNGNPMEEKTESATKTLNGSKAYFVLDRKGRILSANESMERITRYSEEELLELSFFDLLPRENEKGFNEWLNSIHKKQTQRSRITTEIFEKNGDRVMLDLMLNPVLDENQHIMSYRGEISGKSKLHDDADISMGTIDQLQLVRRITETVTTSYNETLDKLLERIINEVCELFRFSRATIALLDKRKRVFVKQAMIGYGKPVKLDKRTLEVPEEVIQRIFAEEFRVKVIYYNMGEKQRDVFLNSRFPERRTQQRRAADNWHPRDLILLNLMNKSETTFGYISLDQPEEESVPTRDTFHNLELFGQLVSMVIENYYQFSEIEKRNRRLKQILVTSNIFKLYLGLTELLKEVVWSIRFSLDFNLVALGLISNRTGNLEIKAVACEDKIKAKHLVEYSIPLQPLSAMMHKDYAVGKSYLVTRKEEALVAFKERYYGRRLSASKSHAWPDWATIIVPIKSRNSKIIGVIIADDPVKKRLPSRETLRTLEIMANQVAVAIDNRIMYVQAKHEKKPGGANGYPNRRTSAQESGLRKLVDRFFR